jgi:predicted dehydrogenase
MNLAIVGAGRAGTAHAEAVGGMPDAHVGAVTDVDAAAARALAQRPACRALGWDEILADPRLDVVALCTPPALHVPLAIKALASGKAVMIEKPVALRAADVDALVAAANLAAQPVGVMHQHRFRVPERVRENRWSPRAAATVEVFRPRPAAHYAGSWRQDPTSAGGGVFAHLAVHYTDLACRALGAPDEIHGVVECEHFPGIDSDVALAVRLSSGSLLTIHASGHAPVATDRLRIVDGERELVVTREGTQWRSGPGAADAEPAPTRIQLRRAAYRDLARALRAGRPPAVCDVASARGVVVLVEAVAALAANGHRARVAF